MDQFIQSMENMKWGLPFCWKLGAILATVKRALDHCTVRLTSIGIDARERRKPSISTPLSTVQI